MASVVIDAASGTTLYLKPSTNGAPTTPSPWAGDVITGTWSSSLEQWTFTITSGLTFLVYQRLGASPANTDPEVGSVGQTVGVGGDIPAPVVPGVCNVRFLVVDSSGVPVEGCYVNVWLEDANPVIDDAMVSRTKIKERTNSSGYVDIEMLQFTQFQRGGTYIVQVSDPIGRRLRESRVRVPLESTCYADRLTEI